MCFKSLVFLPQDMNAHGPLTSNNSDADVGEVTLEGMNPDDIRAELKRLYIQLEIFKNKTIRLDNPHISRRRGGRKAPHRRFSLQVGSKFFIWKNCHSNKSSVGYKNEWVCLKVFRSSNTRLGWVLISGSTILTTSIGKKQRN